MDKLKQQVIAKLKEIYDPELPVDIYELGLIYEIDINKAAQSLRVVMTLTTPNCPAAETLPGEVERALKELEAFKTVSLVLTFDPPYTPQRLSEEARLLLDWFEEEEESTPAVANPNYE